MSFQEKNITVTLVNFTLILGYFLFRIVQMAATESFTQDSVVRLWIVVIIMAVVVTIAGTILTHIVSAIIEAIKTGGEEEPEIEDIADERDNLIDLRGTKATYSVSSFGSLIAMLTFAFGQPPLMMFTLFILFGVLAQIVGDVTRLTLYRKGF